MIKSLFAASILTIGLGGAAFAQATSPGAPPGSAPVTQAPIAPADLNHGRMETNGSVLAPSTRRYHHTARRYHHMHPMNGM
jgi:hypothetical protein